MTVAITSAIGTAHAQTYTNSVEPPAASQQSSYSTYDTNNNVNYGNVNTTPSPYGPTGVANDVNGSVYTQDTNAAMANNAQPTTQPVDAHSYYYGNNQTYGQQGTTGTSTSYAAPVQAQPTNNAQTYTGPMNEEYGVPESNVVRIDGKTIKYKHGSADPEHVIQQETRTLDAKLLHATPRQIQEAQKRAYEVTRALEANPSPSRCDRPRLIHASTSPSSDIPKIRLNVNNTTSLVFSDSSGKSWYLSNVEWPKDLLSVAANEDNENGVSRLSLTPKRLAAQGSLSVELDGNPMPLVLEFSNSNIVDCSVQIRLDDLSPSTKQEFKQNVFYENEAPPQPADSELLSVSMGKKPDDGREMKSSDRNFRAWRMRDGTTLIRTRYEIFSPAPLSHTTQPDGTRVFRVPTASVYMYRYNDMYGSVTVTR